MKQNKRFRISGNYRGARAGSWEINEWLTDESKVRTCIERNVADRKNELVRVVTESRLASGRWGKRTLTEYPISDSQPNK